jgi:hypothetical protein
MVTTMHLRLALLLMVALRTAADVFTDKKAFGRQQGAHSKLMDLASHSAGQSEPTQGKPSKRLPGEPVGYGLHDQYSWETAAKFCKGREGRLCSLSELCPDGKLAPPGNDN